MRVVPILIGAILVLALGLAGLLLLPHLPRGGGAPGGGTIDSGARIDIERMRFQIESQQERIDALEDRLRQLEESRARPAAPALPAAPLPPGTAGFGREGPNPILDAYARVVLIADRLNVNKGITVATPSFLVDFLGRPRERLSDDCEEMTNPALRDRLRLEEVGPIRVRMLDPAIQSLRRVFARIEASDPDLYGLIASSGSLCVRQIRGTIGRVSTHAFGLAVDLNIAGQLDNFADGRTQLGLILIADYFHEEGWVWGAGFRREDSMHFEVSRQQLLAWREEGLI
ncbi:M15 family metallopeptidase [Mangrovicoccus algicola]|uniref:M15 family metallopeptidase n=1 Tax=Mangrovicoccus algicola TaxID=2771008 RepID=A0A8J6YWT2_9RHOB|nr:M15 family metallopeptidase [Mangrovicoccus algicola]MBE3639052.1 M15 family metallopeptidase [Mangrovicoccus algicola]